MTLSGTNARGGCRLAGRVRRARLNYLRALEGKAARIKGEKGEGKPKGEGKAKGDAGGGGFPKKDKKPEGDKK